MKKKTLLVPLFSVLAWNSACSPVPAHAPKISVVPDQKHFRLQTYPAVPLQLVDNTIVLFKNDYTADDVRVLVDANIEQDKIWDGYDDAQGVHHQGWFEIKLALKKVRQSFHQPDFFYHLNLDRVDLDPTPDENENECTDDDHVRPIQPKLDDKAVDPSLLTLQSPADPNDPNWVKLEPGGYERDLLTAQNRLESGKQEVQAKQPGRDQAKLKYKSAKDAYDAALKANPQDPALPDLKKAMNAAKSAATSSQRAVCNALKKVAASEILVSSMTSWIENTPSLQDSWKSWQVLSKQSAELDDQIKEVGKTTAPHVEMYDTQPESITLTPSANGASYDIEIKNWDPSSIPGSGLDKILWDHGKETFSTRDFSIRHVSYDPLGASLKFDVVILSGTVHFELARGLTDAADGRVYMLGLITVTYNEVICDRLGGVGCIRTGSAKLAEVPVNDSDE